jgi:hypothetical protein
MRAFDHDDLVERRLGERREDRREELALLDAAVPRRRARCEDDRGDQWTVSVAFSISTVSVGVPCPPLDGSPSWLTLSTVACP